MKEKTKILGSKNEKWDIIFEKSDKNKTPAWRPKINLTARKIRNFSKLFQNPYSVEKLTIKLGEFNKSISSWVSVKTLKNKEIG